MPPPFHHSRREIVEPDGFGDAVTGIDLSVDFQRRQERTSRVEQFQSEKWALDFGEANVRTKVRGVLRGGWGSFCLSLGSGEAVWNGQRAGAWSLSLLPPGEELDGRTSADFSWLTAAVPSDVWEHCLALAGCERGPSRLAVLQLPEKVAGAIVQRSRSCRIRLRRAATTSAEARLASEEAAALVIDAFTSACEHVRGISPAHGSLRNRARLARLADAWMRDHLDRQMSVPDLCLALRVSRRELEYAFRAVYDVSPRDHFETLRLNAIRRALLRGGGDSVTTVAYAHGVSHLSRFAARYHSLFGEKPSETMRGRAPVRAAKGCRDLHGAP